VWFAEYAAVRAAAPGADHGHGRGRERRPGVHDSVATDIVNRSWSGRNRIRDRGKGAEKEMSTDPITYILLSGIVGINVFIYERIVKLERDIGYIRGYLGLNGTTAGQVPVNKMGAVEIAKKE